MEQVYRDIAKSKGIYFDSITPLTIMKVDALLKRLGHNPEQWNALKHGAIILKVLDQLREYSVKYADKPEYRYIDWLV